MIMPLIYKTLLDKENDKLKIYYSGIIANIETVINNANNDLINLSDDIIEDGFINIVDDKKIIDFYKDHNQYIENYYIYDDKLNVIYSTGNFDKSNDAVRQNIGLIKSAYFPVFLLDDNNLFIVHPLINNNLKCYIISEIKTTTYERIIDNIHLPLEYDYQILILSDKGYLIYHSDLDIKNIKLDDRNYSNYPAVKLALRGKWGINEVKIGDKKFYTISEFLKAIDWLVVIIIPKKIIFNQIFKILLVYIILISIVALIFLIISLRISKIISTPIVKLSKAMRDYSENKSLNEIDYKGADEIYTILNGFYKMVEERNEYNKLLQEISESEKLNLGRDLHDDLGQVLTGISFQLIMLEQFLKENNLSNNETIDNIKNLLTHAIDKTRYYSRGLYPIDLYNNDIILFLEEYSKNIKKIYNIDCKLSCDLDLRINNEFIKINVFRIIQESVNNAIKHGKAQSIEIILSNDANVIKLIIKDNGTGFDIEKIKVGIGLKSIYYRAELINGKCEIKSEIDKGTTIFITFILRD
jgi:signal transduction histidine kinase